MNLTSDRIRRRPGPRGHLLLAVLSIATACGDQSAADDAGPAAYDAASVDATAPAADAARPADAAPIDAPPADADAPVDAGDPCTGCHGTGDQPAPPRGLTGETATSVRGVGAHRAHLRDSDWHRDVVCADCHRVPTALLDVGHIDSARPAELTFGALAEVDDATPAWNGATCAGVYCHGATRGGGEHSAPTWTVVDGSQATCGACHGAPPPAPHPAVPSTTCAGCHPFAGLAPENPDTHIDGELDVVPCGGCHAVPPTSGAHVVHYGDTTDPPLADYGDLYTVVDYLPDGAPYYMFGCGQCHPTDPLRHMDGIVQVELYDDGAPATSLKARNAVTASYSDGTCTGVYCHSTGQAEPVFADTPAWSGGAFAARCASCHDNPPAYPSGGAGAADANTHLVIADDGVEFGHFGGLPGAWHTSYHGTRGAAPITCQTCHYATTDPTSTGPGGFYWLDTNGDYDLGGGLGLSCASCHTGEGEAPPPGNGQVLSATHVNGTRDVVFDPRTALPAELPGLPDAPNRPTYPYWVAARPSPVPPYSIVDGTTWSLHLEAAEYDPVDKTCANVPCHLAQSFGTGRPIHEPLTWGLVPVGYPTCGACHQF